MAQYHEHTYSVQSSDSVVVKIGKHLRGFFWAGAEDPYYTGKPNARQLSAMLKTDDERETRTRLVRALKVANALQGQVCEGNDGEEARPLSSDKAAERSRPDTVHITFDQEYLIQPELYHYQINCGAIFLARPGHNWKQTIYSGGIGPQAYRKRKAITHGFDVGKQSSMYTAVSIKSDEERRLIVQRAREQGYRMSVVSTLT